MNYRFLRNKFYQYYLLILLLFIASNSFAQSSDNLRVTGIKFTGNHTFSSGILKRYIQLNSGNFFNTQILRRDRPQFYDSILQNDIDRLLHFYASEGFAGTKISIIKTINRDKNQIKLTFVIEENEPVKIAVINLNPVGMDSVTSSVITKKIKNQFHLVPGHRFRDVLLTRDKEIILDFLAQNGYPYVSLNTDLELNQNQVTIRFNITPGPFCTFGQTQIPNNINTPAGKIKNQLAFKTDDVFNKDKLQKTQRQIYALGVFQYVSVNALLDSMQITKIPVDIKLKESPRFRTKIGVGYGREDQFRLSADLLKIGFPGKIKRINLAMRHSYLEPYNLSLKWIHPAYPTTNATLIIEPFIKKEREPGYRIRRNGANISFQRNFSDYTDAYLNYSLEQDNLYISKESQEEALKQKDLTLYNKSGFTFGLTRNTSLPLLSPEKGLYAAATATLSGLGFQSDFHFYRFLLEIKKYQQMKYTLVLATKFKIGMIEPLRSGEVTPIEERFYAGGSSSIRGWARSAIGPKNTAREPIGGNSYIEGCFEVRYPVWKKLSGVAFIDYGNVWADEYHYDLKDFRYALGAGLRFSTPIGPIRFDVATPVFETKQRVQYHLSAGHAF